MYRSIVIDSILFLLIICERSVYIRGRVCEIARVAFMHMRVCVYVCMYVKCKIEKEKEKKR